MVVNEMKNYGARQPRTSCRHHDCDQCSSGMCCRRPVFMNCMEAEAADDAGVSERGRRCRTQEGGSAARLQGGQRRARLPTSALPAAPASPLGAAQCPPGCPAPRHAHSGGRRSAHMATHRNGLRPAPCPTLSRRAGSPRGRRPHTVPGSWIHPGYTSTPCS